MFTPEIEYEHVNFSNWCYGFVVETISNGGSSWLVVDCPHDIETGNDSVVFGGLSLRIVEVRGDSDDRTFDCGAEVILCY